MKRSPADIARRRDGILAVLSGAAALAGVLVFAWILVDLLRLGLPRISPGFLTGEVEESGRSGGIGPLIVSTSWIVLVSLAVSLPLGVGSAVWLAEVAPPGSRRARVLTVSIDLLATVPSIVFGLFGMAFFCQFLGLGYSILSGGLTLGCMVLPILLRITLSSLRSLPDDLRPTAAGLGLSRTTTLLRLLLPSALPGIAIAVTIGLARALSETAALIFTSGYATRWPERLTDSGRSLSVHIYDLAMNIPNGAANASATALVLLVLLLVINGAVAIAADRFVRRSRTNLRHG